MHVKTADDLPSIIIHLNSRSIPPISLTLPIIIRPFPLLFLIDVTNALVLILLVAVAILDSHGSGFLHALNDVVVRVLLWDCRGTVRDGEELCL